MPPHTNIYLIGPMGAGKSSIGSHLAKKTQLPFFDSDREIEQRSGASIDWIFEVEGEPGYRLREKKVILDITQTTPLILSTGGGTITIPEVRECLASTGIVIYLQVPFKEQLERTLRRPEGRPILSTDDTEQTLKKTNTDREPLYESIADLTYTAAFIPPTQLANKIWKDIQSQYP